MNKPDWKELADDDAYEDGSFMVIGRVGPNEHIIDEQDNNDSVVVQGQSVETPSPTELLPEEVRKIMEAPTSVPASVPDIAKSTISLAESLTPSFVTGENPSLTTNGSSLSNSSTEAIFDNATNQVAHLTEENQILKSELEKHRELTKENIETWRQFGISAAEQHQADKEKHEISRQLVLKLREEKDELKSRISILEGQLKNQMEDKNSLTASSMVIGSDELKSLEAKLTVKDDSLWRLKSLLEENEALLTEEKYQNELLKKLLREQEVAVNSKITELHQSSSDSQSKEEWDKERELIVEELRRELECARITFEAKLQKKENQIETMKREIQDLQQKIDNLNDYNITLEKDVDTSRCAALRIEKQLEQSQSESILLTTKVAAMKAENEHTVNLKQEMEAFRVDYLTERENRSKAEDEKSALLLQFNAVKEELQRSQDELEQLHKTHLTFATEHVNRDDNFASLHERTSLSPSPTPSSPMIFGNKIMGYLRNELFRSRDDEAASVDSQSASGSRTEETVQPSAEPEIQPCPVCNKKFPTVSKLQKHAATCGLESENEEFTDPFVFP